MGALVGGTVGLTVGTGVLVSDGVGDEGVSVFVGCVVGLGAFDGFGLALTIGDVLDAGPGGGVVVIVGVDDCARTYLSPSSIVRVLET